MSEDYGWRATTVEMHIDAQAKIIEVLRAEVRAWRKGGVARQPDDEICEAINATNATLAKHNERL